MNQLLDFVKDCVAMLVGRDENRQQETVLNPSGITWALACFSGLPLPPQLGLASLWPSLTQKCPFPQGHGAPLFKHIYRYQLYRHKKGEAH